jgi:glutamyl-tRNA synthetase
MKTIGKMKNLAYHKSERKDLYQYATELINSGNAYYAFDTAKLWMKPKIRRRTR